MNLVLAVLALLCAAPAAAQLDEAGPEADPTWAVSTALFAYASAADQDYLQPTVTADRAWLHVEARVNYEFIDAGSAWLGYNLYFGDAVRVAFTPMVGVIFGSVEGLAPGYHLELDWRRLSFYTEGEYVFDTGSREDSYFYSWSELTFEPLPGLHAGLVAQRTRAWEGPLAIQRGLLLGYGGDHLGVTAYVFNPDRDDATWVLALELDF